MAVRRTWCHVERCAATKEQQTHITSHRSQLSQTRESCYGVIFKSSACSVPTNAPFDALHEHTAAEHLPCKPKVTQADSPVSASNQHILWLQVPVDHALAVQVVQCLQCGACNVVLLSDGRCEHTYVMVLCTRSRGPNLATCIQV